VQSLRFIVLIWKALVHLSRIFYGVDEAMTIVVQKFGGTSLANLTRIKAVAAQIKQTVDGGHKVAVVVSAMAGVTNDLVAYCDSLSKTHDPKEYDTVVAAGEQVSAGLLAIALQTIGVSARSFLGWQLPIRTNNMHGDASIESIETSNLQTFFKENSVAVISGFQGLNLNNRITTLGRGGSDYTAVALAVALKALRCDIYKDVDGVYTADPKQDKQAKKLEYVSYQNMLAMIAKGASVLQKKSVLLAMHHQMPLYIRTSFDSSAGSLVTGDADIPKKDPKTQARLGIYDEYRASVGV